MHAGRAVADIGCDVDAFAQHLSSCSGQTFAEGQLIPRAISDPFDTQLPRPIKRDGHSRIRQFDKTGVINAGRHQIFRKIHAHARAGGFGLHLVIQHAKAVFARDIVQHSGGIVTLLQALC